jgi:hypothetical protein
MGKVAVDIAFLSWIYRSIPALSALTLGVADPIRSNGSAFGGLPDEATIIALFSAVYLSVPTLGAKALIGDAYRTRGTRTLLGGKHEPRIAFLS